jgi:hypothetical protein
MAEFDDIPPTDAAPAMGPPETDPGPVPDGLIEGEPGDLRDRIRTAIVDTTERVAGTRRSWLEAVVDAALQVARAGADDTPVPDACEPNPGQWVALFVDSTADKRRLLATRVLEYANTSQQCFMMDHVGALAQQRVLFAQLRDANMLLDAANTTINDLRLTGTKHTQTLRVIAGWLESNTEGDAAILQRIEDLVPKMLAE